MSLTYGFYDSINRDRTYTALQMSSIFDGVINDGVFESIGTYMTVKANEGMIVNVGIGRAWFNHTWTDNDAAYPLTVPTADIGLDRIDAVVLEVDHTATVRANSFKIVQGTAASSPEKPTLTDNDYLHQHALAYITVKASTTSISDSNIENVVGTTECPFVTGILETADITELLTQWKSQFDEWFADLKVTLDDNVAAALLNKINTNKENIATMQPKLEIHTGTLTAGETTITISDEGITTDSVLSFYTSIYGVNPEAVSIAEGSVTLTFDEQESDMEVGVQLNG